MIRVTLEAECHVNISFDFLLLLKESSQVDYQHASKQITKQIKEQEQFTKEKEA